MIFTVLFFASLPFLATGNGKATRIKKVGIEWVPDETNDPPWTLSLVA